VRPFMFLQEVLSADRTPRIVVVRAFLEQSKDSLIRSQCAGERAGSPPQAEGLPRRAAGLPAAPD
jgi:hypothetical protein